MKASAIIALAAAAAAAWWVSSASAEEWRAFVYPDRGNLARHVEAGTFGSIEACRDAALATIQANGWTGRADYECGLNCKDKLGGWPLVCKETRR
jgi:hypothetical protein